ncbi:MAG: PIN domain-containing protein [Egibacteraceae bacterium]
MDVILDAHGVTCWTQAQVPAALLLELEAAQRDGGIVVVPTIAIVESTVGNGRRDARINLWLKSAQTAPLTLPLARIAARLRATASLKVSAADAVVAATAVERDGCVLITSDPRDLTALCAGTPVRVVAV